MGQTSSPQETHGYAFGGPLGAAAMTIGLPVLCYIFAFACNDVSGCPAPSLLHPSSLDLERLKQEVAWPGFSGLLNTEATLGALGIYLWSLVLYRLLPAQEAEGVELNSGGRLKYRLNAFNSLAFTLALAAAGTMAQGPDFPLWTFLYDNYIQLMTAHIIISYLVATFVYVYSFSVKPGNKERRELAAGGHSGNMLYDWFIGRELNPRVTLPFFGEIDIKIWMELRPGFMQWILLNLAFVAHQYKTYGYVTDSMLIVTISQALYLLDGIYMESAILTTIDITTDGFGFMLAFGDLVWVPFTYSLQAHYLAVHPVYLGYWSLAVLAVFGLGFYIFRAANNEKNRFRTNPDDPRVAHLEYIQTKRGTRLLVTGWWGTARHINYLGDWVMSWAYCLPTGISGYVIQSTLFQKERGSSEVGNVPAGRPDAKEVVPGEALGWGMLVTYFFMVYFAVLLIHRERRDDAKCRQKYGKDWDTYCKKVPWRIVPGVY